MAEANAPVIDYSLANPDTLTKYKTAGQISQKVLEAVTAWCTEGAKILEICQKGDKLLEDEVGKVYKGKKIAKGQGHPTTISPSSYVTPYTPLVSDTEEAERTLKAGEIIKIQLGAQIDGFGTIVCDNVVVGGSAEKAIPPERQADLLLATHYANELLLRLITPAGINATTEEERKKAAAQKPASQTKINTLLEKVGKAYNVNLVENTTCWLFERNDIESKKKIIFSPGEGSARGDGLPEAGEVWGLEVSYSLGAGKTKSLSDRATLYRRTATTYGLKRPSSRATLSEIVKKFGTFPFSLRQLEDERAAKVGVVECTRGGVLRQYEVVGEKDGEPISRLFTTVAVTKNGVTRLAAPPALDVEKYKTENKITDDEILKLLEQPIAKAASTKPKNKKKKKKPAKKANAPAAAAAAEEDDSDDDDSDDE